jgi:acyl-CoA oxidase
MLIIRSVIPIVCSQGIAKACTIATRYSLVRTQFKDEFGREIPILDYQLQQDKVIPRIAEAYALLLGAVKINEISRQVFYDAK